MTMKQLWLSRWFGKVGVRGALVLGFTRPGGGGVTVWGWLGQCGVGGLGMFNISGYSAHLGGSPAHAWVRQWGGPQRGWPSSGCSPGDPWAWVGGSLSQGTSGVEFGVSALREFWAGVWGHGLGLGSPCAEVWGHGLGWGDPCLGRGVPGLGFGVAASPGWFLGWDLGSPDWNPPALTPPCPTARAPPAALQHQGQEEVGAGGGRCPPVQPCSRPRSPPQ